MWFDDKSIIPNFRRAQSIWILRFFRVNEKLWLGQVFQQMWKPWICDFLKTAKLQQTTHWFWRKMSRDLFRRVLMTQLGAKSQRVSSPPMF